MRETGPVGKQLTGDTEAATTYIGIARTQLGLLKNQMALGGVQTGARQLLLPDGTSIRVSMNYGIPRIQIDSPSVSAEEQQVEVPQEQFTPAQPELPPRPPRYIIQAIRGLLAGSGTGLYPFSLNGQVITAPSNPGQVLALGPHVKYGFVSGNTGNLFMVAIVDADTGAMAPSQSTITASSPRGDFAFYPPQIIAPTVITPAGVRSLGGKSEPGDLTFLGLNPAWDDVEIKLTATASDGSSADNSFILAGGAMMLAAVGGLAGQPVVIDGVSTTTGVTVPCPSNQINVSIPVASGTSYGVILTTEIGYNPPKPQSGTYLSGGNYDLEWVAGSGDFSLAVSLTLNEIIMTGTATGSGTHTASGTLTVGDGYGAKKDIPVNITVTIP